MIRVQELDFDYPGQRVLEGVSFELEPRRITALVGPNGAGKTTLMRCIAALSVPTSGRILVKGVDTVENPRLVHSLCCYMPDLFGLYDRLSVKHCVEYAYASHVGADADDFRVPRIREILELTDLTGLQSHLVGSLSRGQRQRVALAQALVHDPEVVVLDEPASGLDPLARADLSKLLLKLREQGKTLLVSSHILGELQEYSDRVLLLEQGRIMSHQNLRELLYEEGHERRRLRVVLSEARADLPELLGKLDGVGEFAWEGAGQRAGTFSFRGDQEEQGKLLKRLLEDGVPLVSLEQPASLQQAYVRRLRGGPPKPSGAS